MQQMMQQRMQPMMPAVPQVAPPLKHTFAKPEKRKQREAKAQAVAAADPHVIALPDQ